MRIDIGQLTKDISTIDQEDILSSWLWLLPDIKDILMITCMGDLFLEAKDGTILFLQYDGGELEIVAENKNELKLFLEDDVRVDNWFLPLLVAKLVAAGKYLKTDEVYSLKKYGVLGGDYVVRNIEPTNISVHFSLAGQISRQIWDLPDGTTVNTVVVN